MMPTFAKKPLLLIILITFLTGSSVVYSYLTGDLDGNYKVDSKDLRLFAWQWLDPDCFVPGCTADFDNADGVNMADFALFANKWQTKAPHIIISEFMARNSITLPDGDGLSSDWIELYNPTDTNVCLDGWYLTDYKPNLTMWQFPDGLVVGPGKFRVFFASEKTQELYPYNYPYLDPAGYYHTNFNLNQDGDYLALVAPDGNTIAHKYSPEYPTQLPHISYGMAQYAATLVATGATAKYHVPNSSDSSVGSDWTDLDFDDSTWETEETGLC